MPLDLGGAVLVLHELWRRSARSLRELGEHGAVVGELGCGQGGRGG
ncbi:MAG: hypothetical protein M5R42_12915 [Rhodocyclaceae bacterium]|nr:hypothetical protein [Rhodocyclaceae bacterium]